MSLGEHGLPAPAMYTIVVLAGADTTLENPARAKPRPCRMLEPQSWVAWAAGHVKRKPRMGKHVRHSAKHMLETADTSNQPHSDHIPNLPAALDGSDEKGKDCSPGLGVQLIMSAQCVITVCVPFMYMHLALRSTPKDSIGCEGADSWPRLSKRRADESV